MRVSKVIEDRRLEGDCNGDVRKVYMSFEVWFTQLRQRSRCLAFAARLVCSINSLNGYHITILTRGAVTLTPFTVHTMLDLSGYSSSNEEDLEVSLQQGLIDLRMKTLLIWKPLDRKHIQNS